MKVSWVEYFAAFAVTTLLGASLLAMTTLVAPGMVNAAATLCLFGGVGVLVTALFGAIKKGS